MHVPIHEIEIYIFDKNMDQDSRVRCRFSNNFFGNFKIRTFSILVQL